MTSHNLKLISKGLGSSRSFILCILILSLTSCFTYNQNGYPKKVHFPAQGGSEIISGNVHANIDIFEDDEWKTAIYHDKDTIEYDWIKIIRLHGETPSFELTAAPNNTPKQRKLFLHLSYVTEYGGITVTQKGR